MPNLLSELPEFHLQDIETEQLHAAFRAMGNTAAGMDAWAPAELRDIPRQATQWMAAMLNRVEKGMKWPSDITKARVAYIAKEQGSVTDPMQFRGLTIMSAIYRVWAKQRLHMLEPWVRQWAPPEACARGAMKRIT